MIYFFLAIGCALLLGIVFVLVGAGSTDVGSRRSGKR